MVLIEDALAVGGRDDRRVERLGQRPDLGSSPACPAACDDERRPGTGQRLGGGGDHVHVEYRAARGLRGRDGTPPLAFEHVEGHLDVDRSGPFGGEERERIGDRLRGAFGGAGATRGHEQVRQRPGGVLRLVQHADVSAFQADRHTGGEDEHRPRFGVGGRRGGDDVRQPRSRGGDDDPGLAGDEEVPVGPVAGALFVARGDRPDSEVGQVPVELQVVGAGDPEDRVDAVGGQRCDDGQAAVVEALFRRRGGSRRGLCGLLGHASSFPKPRPVAAGPLGSLCPPASAAHRLSSS